MSKKSKIKVDMGPDLPGNGFYRVRIDVKRGGEWFRYLKSAKTQGAQETRTTNVPKGTYRVKCYGPTEAQGLSRSGVVKIKKYKSAPWAARTPRKPRARRSSFLLARRQPAARSRPSCSDTDSSPCAG